MGRFQVRWLFLDNVRKSSPPRLKKKTSDSIFTLWQSRRDVKCKPQERIIALHALVLVQSRYFFPLGISGAGSASEERYMRTFFAPFYPYFVCAATGSLCDPSTAWSLKDLTPKMNVTFFIIIKRMSNVFLIQ